jgi:DNA-binding FadR family transcriptional regulator
VTLRTPADRAPLPAQAKGSKKRPSARTRAGDHVFATLAREILCGGLSAGGALGAQRELARRFKVSSAVMSQAVHRLEALGLVRVRHGSLTTVLDPSDATDVRLLELQLELGIPGERTARAAAESQASLILVVLTLAQRRINATELERIERCVAALPEDVAREPENFVLDFWGALARATRNPLLEQQMRWWTSLMQRLEQRGLCGPAARRRLPTAVYRGLIEALRARTGAPEFWLKVVTPLFGAPDPEPSYLPAAPLAR